MSKKILTFLVFLGAVFLLAPQIHASGDHMHSHDLHSHDNGTISPFEKHKGETSLHCLLKGHQLMINCPHAVLDDSESNRSFMIMADCGTPTMPLAAEYSSDQTFFENFSFEIDPWIPSQGIHFSALLFTQFQPHPLDHPPQL
jgi:hypothetical protein